MSDQDDELTSAFEEFAQEALSDEPIKVDKAEETTEVTEAEKPEESTEKAEDNEVEESPKETEQPQEQEPEKKEEVEAPQEVEQPATLTKEDILAAIREERQQEQSASSEVETATKDVLEEFYPTGLSRVLVDEATGKKLLSPLDVVEAAQAQGSNLTVEEASQWLMNQQYELNKQVDEIENDARKVAENTLSFRKDTVSVVEKYQDVFEKFPHKQKEAYDLLMRQVKLDDKKMFVLNDVDVVGLYDAVLGPYKTAIDYQAQKAAETPPEPTKPTAADRMDIDGGTSGADDVDDPNDFAQQLVKELAKGA